MGDFSCYVFIPLYGGIKVSESIYFITQRLIV